ncbi:hypothetical protein Zmor_010531 [Zophobas morio]|uniref:Uncharacterized protein n=1 Tax=Zophobas morio TaxID=2755281 RepID=A0AA38INR2_9CUCU|nr:hypothetical protein Zmor_010531 [Zophobas morio]
MCLNVLVYYLHYVFVHDWCVILNNLVEFLVQSYIATKRVLGVLEVRETDLLRSHERFACRLTKSQQETQRHKIPSPSFLDLLTGWVCFKSWGGGDAEVVI